MQMNNDTIAAIATPAGRGGIGIIRVSGPLVADIAASILAHLPAPRQANYLPFRDTEGRIIDHGIALFFPAPHSFSGEDVLELQGHGGPVVLDMLLRTVIKRGARLARPGEFSERAFLNDKIDLAQAEAIADLIDSASEQAARSALRSLEGEFSRQIHSLVADITALRVYVEGAIDFPEEEIDFLSAGNVAQRLDALQQQLDQVIAAARQGCLLREGMNVVIAGRPNAGKSSLLNRLARRETAIVTEVPGTTRDVLREAITIDGMPLHLIDTAGLRDSDDPVERLGIQRARQEIDQADRVLLVVDQDTERKAQVAEFLESHAAHEKITIICNKIDLNDQAPSLIQEACGTVIHLSALSGAGIDLLCEHLKEVMGYQQAVEGSFTARRRHLEALSAARVAIAQGAGALQAQQAGELLAEDLRQAQQLLGRITGEVSADALLGEIFASFCIGK